MKHLKTFEQKVNEGLFDFLKNSKDDDIDGDMFKRKKKDIFKKNQQKLIQEAKEKFNSVIKNLNKKLRSTEDGIVEVIQIDVFSTPSERINRYLMKMVETYYKDRGFNVMISIDGRDNHKHDYFRISPRY